MSNILEYTLKLNENLSSKLKQIGINNEKQLDTWAQVQKQVSAAELVMHKMGRSIGSISQRITALKAQKEWIPTSNRAAIRATNLEIQKLEKELRSLDAIGSGGGLISKWVAPLKQFINPLTLAATGTYALTRYVGESKNAYMEESVEVAKLQQIMANTMGVRGNEIDSILKLTSAQQKLGVIGDETQLTGAQELSTYLTQKESLEKLLPAMNDMLAQQYGLNATQEQASNIGMMLGKVMLGQTGALSRYGYAFDEAQEKILKTGTEAERAAVLFDVVNEAVGGVNEALAKTPEGKLKQQANNMGDLQERVGKLAVEAQAAFTPVIAAIGNIMDKVLTWLEAHQPQIQAFLTKVGTFIIKAFNSIWKVLKNVVKGVIFFIDQVRNGNPIFLALAFSIGTMVIGLTALGIAAKLHTVITTLQTNAQWLLNAAMTANPIALVIALIAAMIALVVVVIAKYNEWGAAMSFLAGPFMVIINIVMALRRNWEKIKEAFTDGGILNGLKRIGIVLIDALLYPIQQLLDMVAKIPGVGAIAGNISAKIAEMRKGLDLVDPPKKEEKSLEAELEEEMKKLMGGDDAPNINFKNNTTDAIVTGGSRSTNVTINFKNLIENIAFNGTTKENMQEIERNLAEGMFRVLNIAQSSVS